MKRRDCIIMGRGIMMAQQADELVKLGKSRFSPTKIFFSNIVGNLFFAEVSQYGNKSLKYDERPQFGSALIYMFVRKDEEVSLIRVKEIHYN